MRCALNQEKQREYGRAHRERNRALGLNGNGSPRKPVSHAAPSNYLDLIRRDALEAMTWIASKRRRDPAHLLGLHAFASNLPLEWWRHRDSHSINSLIDAVEREMEQRCQPT